VLPLRGGGGILSDMEDSELLQAYVCEGDESGFGELVRRYVDFVFSVALRRLEGDSGLAETSPEIRQLLADDAETRRLAAKPESNRASLDDLVAALRLP
jgi:hypothetical protein